jgi:membrane-bound lytic murein transglycosylase D
MDPFKATVAAARLLKNNRAVTGSWPLAMTGYNHGAAGMRRAARKLGTSDIVTVVRRYQSRTFGFASRNFYVAFLAAIDVHYNAEKYFGTLERDRPVESETVKVPSYMTVTTLSRELGIDRATLRAHNLALRPAVWNGNKRVPRGYELRIPSNEALGSAEAILAAIVPKDRYHKQTRDDFYKVRRGDTLGGIAARFGARVDDLMAANNLRSRHRIRVGQVLRLPGPDTKSKVTLASARPLSRVRLSIPTDGLYTVQSGDTLSLIAGRFAIDAQQLVRLNQLNNKHRIYLGQVLRLTESAVASAEPAASATSEPTAEVETGAGSQIMSEPTEVTIAEETGTFLVAPARTTLAADPSDYTVSDGRTIEVQAAETLGHYAEWLGLRASRLRQLNDMRYREPVVIGQWLRLDFSQVSIEDFEQRRLAYHRALQDEFFTQFRIAGTETHTVRRGDSLWILSQRTYDVPIWLLRQYNPNLDFNTVLPGTAVTIPLVQDRPEPAPPPRVDPVLWYTG